jgi:hypothetical protein
MHGLPTIAQPVDGKTQMAETFLDAIAEQEVVLDQQDSHRGAFTTLSIG